MLAITGCFFVGCGKDYNTIELNEVTHSIFYAPLYVAMNKGYFAEEGLTVNLTNGGGSDTSMKALVANSADIILAGPETAVYTEAEGISDVPKVFGQLTHCDGSFIVAKNKHDNFTIEDLVGETIIGGRKGGLPAMTLQYIIENGDVNGVKDYKIGTGADEINFRDDVAFNLTASVWWEDSSVEYCTLFEPTATNMVKEGKGHIVASLGELSGSIPYTCFIAKSSYLKDHSDVAEKFLNAVIKGYNFIHDNDSKVVAEALKKSFETNSIDELKVAVEQYLAIEAWSQDMAMTSESFDTLMNVMLNAKHITEKSVFENVVDNTIANKLKA